jgi:hypothetical protein
MKKYTHPEMRSNLAYKDYFAVKADFDIWLNEMPDSYVSALTNIFAFHSGNEESNPLMQMVEVFYASKGVRGWKENCESLNEDDS